MRAVHSLTTYVIDNNQVVNCERQLFPERYKISLGYLTLDCNPIAEAKLAEI